MVETRTQERPWECDSCGLVHTHYPGFEHSIRGMAAGPMMVLRELEYNPDCHCGIREMVVRCENGDITLPAALVEWLRAIDTQLTLPKQVEDEISEVVDSEP